MNLVNNRSKFLLLVFIYVCSIAGIVASIYIESFALALFNGMAFGALVIDSLWAWRISRMFRQSEYQQ